MYLLFLVAFYRVSLERDLHSKALGFSKWKVTFCWDGAVVCSVISESILSNHSISLELQCDFHQLCVIQAPLSDTSLWYRTREKGLSGTQWAQPCRNWNTNHRLLVWERCSCSMEDPSLGVSMFVVFFLPFFSFPSPLPPPLSRCL